MPAKQKRGMRGIYTSLCMIHVVILAQIFALTLILFDPNSFSTLSRPRSPARAARRLRSRDARARVRCGVLLGVTFGCIWMDKGFTFGEVVPLIFNRSSSEVFIAGLELGDVVPPKSLGVSYFLKLPGLHCE